MKSPWPSGRTVKKIENGKRMFALMVSVSFLMLQTIAGCDYPELNNMILCSHSMDRYSVRRTPYLMQLAYLVAFALN